jgi:hypothetical protein
VNLYQRLVVAICDASIQPGRDESMTLGKIRVLLVRSEASIACDWVEDEVPVRLDGPIPAASARQSSRPHGPSGRCRRYRSDGSHSSSGSGTGSLGNIEHGGGAPRGFWPDDFKGAGGRCRPLASRTRGGRPHTFTHNATITRHTLRGRGDEPRRAGGEGRGGAAIEVSGTCSQARTGAMPTSPIEASADQLRYNALAEGRGAR